MSNDTGERVVYFGDSPHPERPVKQDARRIPRSAQPEVGVHVERLRKLAELASRRLTEGQQLIAVDEAMALMAQLVDTVRAHVTDRATLAAITTTFSRLVGPDA